MAPDAAMSERSTEPRQYAVSFVLPAYNEESNIVEVLSSAIAAGERYCRSFEVIVVDDGSVDRTAQLVRGVAAQRNHVQLVCHDRNEGYGMALRTGFANAGFDLIFFTDADGQFDFDDLRLLLAWIPHADVVVGYRSTRRDAAQRRLNAWAWNRIMRWLFYVPVRDIDCAFKLFRRSALTGVDLFSTGAMVNTELIVKLARA